MLDDYVLVDGKKLRKGFTTGTAATAAAKAALLMLINQEPIDEIGITLPQGQRLVLPIEEGTFSQQSGSCGVIKDGGDDPDVTSGLLIKAQVEWQKERELVIEGGIGVGRVTRIGLPVSVGEPAINPVPRKMITEAISPLLREGEGVRVIISVPNGEEVAKKTFNPRLGIEGGISILGTTGIVEPMSEEAFKKSLALKIKQRVAEGEDFGVLIPGNYGKKIATQEYGFAHERLIKTSNFIGYILEACLEYGLNKILLIGHLGKLIKVAGGIFHTHSRTADGRQEIMASFVGLFGGGQELIRSIFEAATTEAMVELLDNAQLEGLYLWIADRIARRCRQYVKGGLEVEVVLFTMERGILAESTGVKSWRREGWML